MPEYSDDVTRRTILGVSGGVIGAGALSSTVTANGQGNSGGPPGGGPPGGPPDGKNTCPEGTVLLAKYEVEGDEFVFEKDSDYLGVGDAFDLTVTKTKDGDDGEILAFEIEDPLGVYDIRTLSVKAGPNVFRKQIDDTDGEFDAEEFDDSPPVQAISNVLVCARVWWQVDFGRGEVPEPPDYDLEDLPYAATGNGTEDTITNPSVNRADFPRFDYVDVVEPPGIEIDLDEGTATIEFKNNTAEQMHLASFETPGEFSLGEIEFQRLFDVKHTTDEEGTLTIDIPIEDDFKDS